MKRFIIFVVIFGLLLDISACSIKTVEWNGKTQELANVLMIEDITDLYRYVGLVDYVFVGTVEEIEKNVIPAKNRKHEDSYSVYRIHVDRNLKGNLTEEIICNKLGGFKKDGTMLLISAEMPTGITIMDNGLPEKEKQYIFLAYGQEDGSLILSEIFDNRECDEALLAEYMDYVDNEIPYDRRRFPSKYEE